MPNAWNEHNLYTAAQLLCCCVQITIFCDVMLCLLVGGYQSPMWNIILFASLGISIYEILCRFLLHSTYRYMKHFVDAFSQHIDLWNIVLMPSFNISIYETLCWCLHSTYRYMKHWVDAFIEHIDIWNIVSIPSFNISIYENLCWTH
jgi:hypothetical protein